VLFECLRFGSNIFVDRTFPDSIL